MTKLSDTLYRITKIRSLRLNLVPVAQKQDQKLYCMRITPRRRTYSKNSKNIRPYTIYIVHRKGGSMEPMEPHLDPPQITTFRKGQIKEIIPTSPLDWLATWMATCQQCLWTMMATDVSLVVCVCSVALWANNHRISTLVCLYIYPDLNSAQSEKVVHYQQIQYCDMHGISHTILWLPVNQCLKNVLSHLRGFLLPPACHVDFDSAILDVVVPTQGIPATSCHVDFD